MYCIGTKRLEDTKRQRQKDKEMSIRVEAFELLREMSLQSERGGGYYVWVNDILFQEKQITTIVK